MHITFLCPHTKVGSGGVKVIFRMAQGMKEYGYGVTVVTKKMKGNFEFLLGKKPAFSIVEIEHPTIHNFPKTDCIVDFGDGETAAPIPDVPHVLYLQGFGTQQYDRECINLMYKYDLVITTSSWLARIAKNFGHKTCVVPPGIDEFFKPIKVPKIGVITLGTLYHPAPMKNIAVANAAFSRIYSGLNGNAKVIYLTAHPPEDMKKFFEELPFVFSFAINPPQRLLPAMYSSCDAWVSPSLNEGFGLTTLEAMSCGTPVVSCRNLGLDDYLKDGENCLLVDEAQGMATAIRKILDDDKLKTMLVVNGLELAKKFTWAGSYEKFQKALQVVGIKP